MTEFLKHFDINIRGRDFVVGDLHGCRALFDEKLDEIGFDPAVDRMFSVGDLIDRGPDSPGCFALLAEPWFHAIRGNHEQGWIDFARGPGYDPDLRYMRSNGGNWDFSDVQRNQVHEDHSQSECLGEGGASDLRKIGITQKHHPDFIHRLNELPYAIEIDTPFGLVGIVHAELPDGWSWHDLKQFLADPDGVAPEAVKMHDHGWAYNDLLYALLESREQGKKVMAYSRDFSKTLPSNFSSVAGVERVYSGHTPIEGGLPLLHGNHYWLDTHAYETNDLSIVQIVQNEELWAFRESMQ